MITVLSLSPAIDKIYFINEFSAGNLYRVGEYQISAGGKGINVARVLSMLGVSANVMGFKAGSNGEWLHSNVAQLGCSTAFITVDGESRINNNIIDLVKKTETEILEAGPVIHTHDWKAFLELFSEKIKHEKYLVCSGGLPKGLDHSTYAQLIKIAKQNGVITILDSSGEVLSAGIEERPYIIKPNIRELSNYIGKDIKSDYDIYKASKDIIKRGVGVVCVSLGRNGAMLVTDEVAYKAKTVDITAVNTIGSGDSMVAGICYSLMHKNSLEECLKLGCACGASNAEFSQIGHVDIKRVGELYNSIELVQLD